MRLRPVVASATKVPDFDAAITAACRKNIIGAPWLEPHLFDRGSMAAEGIGCLLSHHINDLTSLITSSGRKEYVIRREGQIENSVVVWSKTKVHLREVLLRFGIKESDTTVFVANSYERGFCVGVLDQGSSQKRTWQETYG